MSIWIHPKLEDINIDHDAEEVDIFVSSDDGGNNYISLTFKQIVGIYKEIIKDQLGE